MNIERILIMEDDMQLRGFLEAHLKRRSYQVVAVASIGEGRRVIGEGEVDLIISDIRFPDGDGVEFLSTLRRNKNQVLHITMTGYGSIASAVEAMRLGSTDYLVKPFTTEQLDLAIQRLENWKRLINENDYLRREQAEAPVCQEILGQSKAIAQVQSLINRVAPTKASVLIHGESGTGKELVARAIWDASPRRDAAFIKLNCAAVPENLLESELFGHEKGSFTGAVARRDGRFQMADGGTLLLDEVSEITLALQAKLLRVLQESEFERVGGNRTVKVDVRIIATTNRNLPEMIKKGEFREDLYYRLNVFPISVPPLRERQGDVELLLKYYLQYFAEQYGKAVPDLDPVALCQLKAAPWRGNVRELQNAAARAVILAEPDRKLQAEDFALTLTHAPRVEGVAANQAGDGSVKARYGLEGLITFQEMERRMIEETLAQTKHNRTHAAQILGISVRTLRNKLQEYKLADLGGAEEKEDAAMESKVSAGA